MGQALSQARRADAAWQGAPRPEGLLGTTPTPAAAPSYPSVEAEMALPPYEDVPVEEMPVDEVPPDVVPAPEEWTPAAAVSPPIKSIPRWTNMQRGFLGRPYTNNSANWPRQAIPGTRSMNTTQGGYPSLNPRDTRPAGVY